MSPGPRELGGGKQWPSSRCWHFGADRWALGPGGDEKTPGKKPVKHTGPEVVPSDKALEQGPPTFLLRTLSELFPQDGCVEGRWPEAGRGVGQVGAHPKKRVSEDSQMLTALGFSQLFYMLHKLIFLYCYCCDFQLWQKIRNTKFIILTTFKWTVQWN